MSRLPFPERRLIDRRAPPPPASQVTRGLLHRFHLDRLIERYPERPMRALFMLINGFISIGILATIAEIWGVPSIFPSLGASAFLLFASPGVQSAWPRSTIVGHLIGIACGIGALWLVGLHQAPPAMVVGVSTSRVVAVALSLALTGAFMVLADAPHPPAGATALIVSLGLITKPAHLLVMAFAVSLLALQAIVINRLAGLTYPLWRGPRPAPVPVAAPAPQSTQSQQIVSPMSAIAPSSESPSVAST